MPIYEYQCESCSHELEALQKLSDAPLVDCPACGKASLKKQISAAGFRLSGGGWYETDFKSGKKKNLAGEGGSSSSPAPSSSPAASS
ncbi:MAG TPA: zinc ribbon domain-containing protein [Cellvibrio sp.]|nr:zinc ribbon domain-containing protein [Cellvibrio sp.]